MKQLAVQDFLGKNLRSLSLCLLPFFLSACMQSAPPTIDPAHLVRLPIEGIYIDPSSQNEQFVTFVKIASLPNGQYQALIHKEWRDGRSEEENEGNRPTLSILAMIKDRHGQDFYPVIILYNDLKEPFAMYGAIRQTGKEFSFAPLTIGMLMSEEEQRRMQRAAAEYGLTFDGGRFAGQLTTKNIRAFFRDSISRQLLIIGKWETMTKRSEDDDHTNNRAAATSQTEQSPEAIVRSIIERSRAILQDSAYQGRANSQDKMQQLEAIILPHFDARRFSGVCLSSHWRDLSDEQKEEFQNLLQKRFFQMYVGFLDKFPKGTQGSYAREKDEADFVTVRHTFRSSTTREQSSVGTPDADYIFRKKDNSWLLYNVRPLASNESVQTSLRRQFDKIIKESSVEELANLLRRKNREFDAGSQSKVDTEEAPQTKDSQDDTEGEVTQSDRSGSREPASADAWADRFARAQYISASAFLEQLRSVRLQVQANSSALRWITRADLSAAVTSWTQAQGLRIANDAPVLMRVVVQTAHGEVHDIRDGVIWKKRPVHQVLVQVSFAVRTPVYREGQFIPLTVYPANGWSMQGTNGGFDRQQLIDLSRESFGDVLNIVHETTETGKPQLNLQWKKSLWASRQNEAMNTAYRRALAMKPEETERTFKGLTTIVPVEVNTLSDAQRFVNTGLVAQHWQTELHDVGFRLDPHSQVKVNHEVGVIVRGSSNLARMLGFEAQLYCTNIDAIRIYEDNVVYEFNGELVRGRVLIWSNFDMEMDVVDENGTVLQRMSFGNVSSLAKEARFRR